MRPGRRRRWVPAVPPARCDLRLAAAALARVGSLALGGRRVPSEAGYITRIRRSSADVTTRRHTIRHGPDVPPTGAGSQLSSPNPTAVRQTIDLRPTGTRSLSRDRLAPAMSPLTQRHCAAKQQPAADKRPADHSWRGRAQPVTRSPAAARSLAHRSAARLAHDTVDSPARPRRPCPGPGAAGAAARWAGACCRLPPPPAPPSAATGRPPAGQV